MWLTPDGCKLFEFQFLSLRDKENNIWWLSTYKEGAIGFQKEAPANVDTTESNALLPVVFMRAAKDNSCCVFTVWHLVFIREPAYFAGYCLILMGEVFAGCKDHGHFLHLPVRKNQLKHNMKNKANKLYNKVNNSMKDADCLSHTDTYRDDSSFTGARAWPGITHTPFASASFFRHPACLPCVYTLAAVGQFMILRAER